MAIRLTLLELTKYIYYANLPLLRLSIYDIYT